MNHYSFPSIEQFRTVIKYVSDRCGYHGLSKPTLKFSGTVKLHGTNAGVVVTPTGEVYAQSRSNVITPESDNAGFAVWVEANKARLVKIARACCPNFNTDTAIYGEWCGQGIQKGVAISQVSKRFVIFAARIVTPETSDLVVDTWLLPSELAACEIPDTPDLTSIYNFPTWEIEIDFNEPAVAQNKLVEITTAVEAECPVGKALGVSGVGEGVVWVCTTRDRSENQPFVTGIKTSDLIFKVKGSKHSDTKTKTLAAVDVEKMTAISELADAVTTDHRLEKGLDQLKLDFPGQDVLVMRFVPHFLKWVGQDVIKEESDMIEESGFEPKEVTKAVNQRAKEWFKKKTEE